MVIIGIDPHKRTHTASVLDAGTHAVLSSLRIDASLAGYRQLVRWAARFGSRRWAVENARGLGAHLAQWLVARGELVEDVPSTATARIRELSRGGRRKNDTIDAAAAASVAALRGEALPVAADDAGTVLGLLEERHANLTTQRTRLVNQLHALLRELIPGGAPADLTMVAPRGCWPACARPGRLRPPASRLARDLITEIRDADQRLKSVTARMTAAVREHGSRLSEVDGIGPVIAARLLGRTRQPSRFRSASAFAMLRGRRARRSGQRRPGPAPAAPRRRPPAQLRTAQVAITQIRMRASIGRAYYDPKIAQGKTPQRSDALPQAAPGRPRLADHDRRRAQKAASPGGHSGATLTSSAAGTTPLASSSEKSLPGPASRLYDAINGRLTNTEEPRVW